MTSTPAGDSPEGHAADGPAGESGSLLDVFARAPLGADLDWSDHVEAILDSVDGLRQRISIGEAQAERGDTFPLDELQDPKEAPQDVQHQNPAGDDTGAEAEADTEALRRRLAEAQAQRDEHLDDLQRLQASFENYRKRIEAEADLTRTRQRNQILSEILPLLDDLAHLEGSSDPGAAAVAASAACLAARLGLVRIDDGGVAFDPHLHEAVALRDRSEADRIGEHDADKHDERGAARADGEAGCGDGPTVALVLRPGWRHQQVTLRPAFVEVIR